MTYSMLFWEAMTKAARIECNQTNKHVHAIGEKICFFYSAHEMKNALVKKKSVRVLKGVERLESRFNVKERSVVVEEGSVVCAVI